MINRVFFLFIFILFFSFSCEENKRSLAGFDEDYECINDSHCMDDWSCINNYCKKDCPSGTQDNNNNGDCFPDCESLKGTCGENKELDSCRDSSGTAIFVCKCIDTYQDNNNDGVCRPACKENTDEYICPENKDFDYCSDETGDAIITCKCEEGYQDNDMDGVCSEKCSETSCKNASCDDSSGAIECICDNDFVNIGDGCTERMVTILSENFFMGCNTDETADNYDVSCNEVDNKDESPYHEVALDSYKIDIYEVTVHEYKKCVNAGFCSKDNFDAKWNYNHNRTFHPMNGVNYYGAKEYCESLGFRLPTEAEWEKAARGTDGRIYPWGNEALSCEYATYDNEGFGCGSGTTSKVGSKALGLSPYGLHDMVGNVWEWSSDFYSENYYTQELMTNPQGPETGTQRVVHGGGWDDKAISIRSSNRFGNSPNSKDIDTGFRCAMSIE